MSIEQIGIAAVAAVVAFWPHLKAAPVAAARLVRPTPTGVSPVSYETAIHNLAVVRARLSSTKLLGDDQKKAIDTLTLALVAGSDQ